MLLKRNTILTLGVCLLGLAISAGAEVAFETEHFSIRIDDTGSVTGLLDHGGVDCRAPDQPAPLLGVRVAGQMHSPQAMRYEERKGTLTLQYAQGVTAVVKAVTKATHVTFELIALEPEGSVELVLWGPYPTRIKETIGETVGVVRNDRFALGIQTLNVKTLGGYPRAENGVMAGRGDTAQPREFGSVLQAFTRDRSRDRVIANWAHEHYHAPAYDDGGVVGSKIALFGCPVREALKTIGEIEITEGLPHPMIDGVWGKVAPGATAAYLIMGFGEETIDEALAITKRAGLKYLYHGGPFSTWGHFQLHPNQFPNGWAGMKHCVEKARA